MSAKKAGSQGVFKGSESTLEHDLKALGLPSFSELKKRLAHGQKGEIKGSSVPDSERDSKNQVGSRHNGGGSHKKGSDDPHAEADGDVEEGSKEHRQAAKEAQNEADAGNQSASVRDRSVKKGELENHEPAADQSKTGTKRGPSGDEGGVAGKEARSSKKQKTAYEKHGRVAHAENAAKVDADPPVHQLIAIQEEIAKKKGKGKGGDKDVGSAVAYWMRLEDIRIVDNRALSLASDFAQQHKIPLVVFFTIVPGDYRAHDRSPRRLDFMLRNLRHIESKLHKFNIPLKVHIHKGNRFDVPKYVVEEILPSLGAKHVFGNIEYEVDELRRDIAVCKLGDKAGIISTFVHDRLAVPPGKILSGKGTPMAVYSPWQRKWAAFLADHPEYLEEFPEPKANDASVKSDKALKSLFESSIPNDVPGFECPDKHVMEKIWPEGTETAIEIHERFLTAPSSKRSLGLVSPLQFGEEKEGGPAKGGKDNATRIKDYASGRNSADANTSSRLSPYLASGVISARMVLNRTKKICKGQKLESGRDTGIGMWVQEVAWRDFYNHVMALFPRVSMGRPYIEKFANVQWEISEDHLQAWKEGKTGFPIVDAAMRQCKYMGWMHNRPRMICASFLVKDLMLDWRLGEKVIMHKHRGFCHLLIRRTHLHQHFADSFIDGDLASNNGGWQWSSSVGTDPQPYFRIFNPTSQSETASPDGAYIRYWVPELAGLSGKAIHDPYGSLSPKEFAKLNYPKPIVDHAKARARALERYKNPGEKPDIA